MKKYIFILFLIGCSNPVSNEQTSDLLAQIEVQKNDEVPVVAKIDRVLRQGAQPALPQDTVIFIFNSEELVLRQTRNFTVELRQIGSEGKWYLIEVN